MPATVGRRGLVTGHKKRPELFAQIAVVHGPPSSCCALSERKSEYAVPQCRNEYEGSAEGGEKVTDGRGVDAVAYRVVVAEDQGQAHPEGQCSRRRPRIDDGMRQPPGPDSVTCQLGSGGVLNYSAVLRDSTSMKCRCEKGAIITMLLLTSEYQ